MKSVGEVDVVCQWAFLLEAIEEDNPGPGVLVDVDLDSTLIIALTSSTCSLEKVEKEVVDCVAQDVDSIT